MHWGHLVLKEEVLAENVGCLHVSEKSLVENNVVALDGRVESSRLQATLVGKNSTDDTWEKTVTSKEAVSSHHWK